jgi:hypothetical protein
LKLAGAAGFAARFFSRQVNDSVSAQRALSTANVQRIGTIPQA